MKEVSESGVIKKQRSEFEIQTKELKNINNFIENQIRNTTSFPQNNDFKKPINALAQDVQRFESNFSRFESQRKMAQSEVPFSKINKESNLKNSSAKFKNYLPSNLNNKIKIRGGIESQSMIPLTTFENRNENEVGKNPEIYQDFFKKMEKMKQTHPKSKFGDNQFNKNKLGSDVKESLVVPLNLERNPKRDMKIQREILQHLEEQIRLETGSELVNETINEEENGVIEEVVDLPIKLIKTASVPVSTESNKIENYDNHPQANMNFEGQNNPIYLKASSLFNDTILYENELIFVSCKTDKSLLAKKGLIVLVLTIKPRIDCIFGK